MRLWQYAIVGLLLAACAVILQLTSCSSEENECLTTWASLDATTRYVGQDQCRSCHEEVYQNYIHTGMGRSWYRPRPDDKIEQFGQVVYDAPSNFYYTAYWADKTLYIKEFRLKGGDTTYRRIEKIDYIVGSGNQTRSYLLLRNGYLYEAPITWYVQKQKWDLSPGYHEGNNSRFDRALGTECVHCHNAYTDHLGGTINKYDKIPLGIDCERCHEPGEKHVSRMKAGKEVDVGREADYSIVNPKRLGIDKQFDICQQCHLQGTTVHKREFRPGMRLADAMQIFLTPSADSESFGIASHAERLKVSQCFVQSGKKLSCTTCHDPHKGTKGSTVTVYRQVCKSCHTDCKLPLDQRAENNCAGCHMPKGGTSDIPHVSFTDHKIRVVSESTEEVNTDPKGQAAVLNLICATDQKPKNDEVGKAYLLYYEQQRLRHPTPYIKKALSLLSDTSYLFLAKAHFYLDSYQQAAEFAAKATGPMAMYWEASALENKGDFAKATSKYLETYNSYRHMVEAGMKAAIVPLRLPSPDAMQSLKLLMEVNSKKPHDKQILMNMGYVELAMGHYTAAEQHLKAALRLDPDYSKAIENLILLYHTTGKAEKRDKLLQQLAELVDAATLAKITGYIQRTKGGLR